MNNNFALKCGLKRFIIRILLTLLPLSGAAQIGCHKDTILSASHLFKTIEDNGEFLYATTDCGSVYVFNLENNICYQMTAWIIDHTDNCVNVIDALYDKYTIPKSWGSSITYLPNSNVMVYKFF